MSLPKTAVVAPPEKSSTTTTLHPHVIVALTPSNEYLKLADPVDRADVAFMTALMGSNETQLDAAAGSLATALLKFASGLGTYVWPDASDFG